MKLQPPVQCTDDVVRGVNNTMERLKQIKAHNQRHPVRQNGILMELTLKNSLSERRCWIFNTLVSFIVSCASTTQHRWRRCVFCVCAFETIYGTRKSQTAWQRALYVVTCVFLCVCMWIVCVVAVCMPQGPRRKNRSCLVWIRGFSTHARAH